MGVGLETVAHGGGAGGEQSHRRILVLMALVGLAGSLAGAVFVTGRFGLGVFVGASLAFVNYFWLKRSLRKIFEAATEKGRKPSLLAAGYFARYAVLGLILAIVFITAVVPVTSFITGLTAFAVAVVLEGLIRIFSSIFSDKEIQ